MSRVPEIRQLYTPVQPTVNQSSENLIYSEFFPEKRLQSFIYCYWQFKTTATLDQCYLHNIVADGCIDIYFETGNPTESYIMGFCDSFSEFQLNTTFNYVGIRFLPTMFSQLFNLSAKEFNNRFEKLSDVLPKLSRFLAERIDPEASPEKIKSTLDTCFLQLAANTVFKEDGRLYESLEIILKKRGDVDLRMDLNTGISARQLRRLFDFYIGDAPKTFSKVVRFQTLLQTNPTAESLKKHKLFFDFGYYDQAHFIKEFKNFYGLTPSLAFSK